jgi:hypothetical protein
MAKRAALLTTSRVAASRGMQRRIVVALRGAVELPGVLGLELAPFLPNTTKLISTNEYQLTRSTGPQATPW